jgi:hypothetical protein
LVDPVSITHTNVLLVILFVFFESLWKTYPVFFGLQQYPYAAVPSVFFKFPFEIIALLIPCILELD